MGFLLSMMRGFSIRLRMVSAIAVVLALLGLVGTAGVWGLQRLETLGEHFAEHAFAESVAMADLRVALSELQRLERDMIIQYERPAEITVIEGRWHQAGSQIDKQVQAILEGEEDEDNPIARELLSSVKAYIKEAESVVVQLKTGAFDTATVANLRLVKAHQHVAHAEMLTRKLTDVVNQEAAQLQAEQRATAQRALLGFGVAVAVAMLVVVPTTLANMQSICQPIEQAQALAQAIASGDLATRVDASGRDEVAALLGALKDMQVSLGGIVGQVHEVATSIRSASAHIAHGNKDLSSRTEHAASSLEETAASLQELTDVVGQTAEAAARASQQAEANAQAAQQGGHAVGQVVTTMEAIDESSQKIGHIIGVIDGIAFQTNILALNAAVEAARAGDAGRGFAVVASEVRSLAQRSAAAAQEIKSLIQASMDKVREGALQVQQAGVTMTNVVGSAQDVSELISGITRSAHDQSQGIMAINASVNELDRSTQQNATLVEQSSEAARALREQAERLNEVVSIFRVG